MKEILDRSGLIEAIQPQVVARDEERPLVDRTLEKIAGRVPLDPDESFALEAIIIPDQRPVLDVLAGNSFTTDHSRWQGLLSGRPQASLAILPGVGRIDLPGHPSLPYGGAGFVVGDGLVMTNRHVAEISPADWACASWASAPASRRISTWSSGATAAASCARCAGW